MKTEHDFATFLPKTADAISLKSDKEKIEILKSKLTLLALVLDAVHYRELHAITGAPIEECNDYLFTAEGSRSTVL